MKLNGIEIVEPSPPGGSKCARLAASATQSATLLARPLLLATIDSSTSPPGAMWTRMTRRPLWLGSERSPSS
jgi:hypothetical protein